MVGTRIEALVRKSPNTSNEAAPRRSVSFNTFQPVWAKAGRNDIIRGCAAEICRAYDIDRQRTCLQAQTVLRCCCSQLEGLSCCLQSECSLPANPATCERFTEPIANKIGRCTTVRIRLCADTRIPVCGVVAAPGAVEESESTGRYAVEVESGHFAGTTTDPAAHRRRRKQTAASPRHNSASSPVSQAYSAGLLDSYGGIAVLPTRKPPRAALPAEPDFRRQQRATDCDLLQFCHQEANELSATAQRCPPASSTLDCFLLL